MPASLVAVPTGLAPTARRAAGIRSCSRRCGPTIRAISPCRSWTRRARNELDDPDVQAKAAAATKWCKTANAYTCLLYTSDAADDLTRVELGGRRIIKKQKTK